MVKFNESIRIPVSALLYRLVIFYIGFFSRCSTLNRYVLYRYKCLQFDLLLFHIDKIMSTHPSSTPKGVECIRTSLFLLNIFLPPSPPKMN